MKLFIRNLCIFLMGMSCWACSDNNNAETDDNGKGAYALFLKKSITVSAGENQTEIVVEWAKTSWEITFEQGDIVWIVGEHEKVLRLSEGKTVR